MMLRFPTAWTAARKLNAELGFETTLEANYRLSSRFSSYRYMDAVRSKSHNSGSSSSIRCCNSTSPSIILNSTSFISDSPGSLGKDICEGISPTSSSSHSHKLDAMGTKSSILGSLPWTPSYFSQRAWLVLIFLLTFPLQTSAFVMSSTRWQKRPLHLFPSMKDEKLLSVCQKVIDEQPAVLVHSGGQCLERTQWNGTVVALTGISDPGILPFLDRLTTVTSMTSALLNSLKQAQRVYEGSYKNQRALSLVGSGAVYGVGKTRIGHVVCQCLASILPADQRVISAAIDIDPAMAFHQVWNAVCESVPELAGLSTIVEKEDMTMMTPTCLMAHMARYLTAHNLFLFLHLDEFRPFGELGNAKDEHASFHNCWQGTLMGILSTPRICLYISGRMPYFETLGAYPCRVHSAQLELFDPAVICSALNKIFIPGAEDSDGGTAALSEVLNSLPTSTGTRGTEDVARRLHELTGGLPRFVEHAVYALLSDPTFGPAVFKHNVNGISAATLDCIFGQSGSVYTAVKAAAESHFEGVLAEAGSENARQEHLTGLMHLLLLRGTGIELSETQVQILVKSHSTLYPCPVVTHYLEEAHFWRIHRNIKKRDEGGGLLTFAVPPPMLDVLVPFLHGLTTPNLQKLTEWDASGMDARKAAKLALTFHSHLASLIPHPNWLGLSEDPPANEVEAGAVAPPLETSKAPSTNVLTWEMPTLPTVGRRGTLNTVESVADITYGRNITDQRLCPPHLVGKLLASLSPEGSHVFATTMWSTCADFVVRRADDVTHLQVKNPEKLLLATYLSKIAKIAPIVQSSLDLHHTLVLVVTNPTGLTKALTLQQTLSTKEELASKLEARAAVKEEKVKATGRGTEKDKILSENLRAAAKLVRDGHLTVKVLNETQLQKFFRRNTLKTFPRKGFFSL